MVFISLTVIASFCFWIFVPNGWWASSPPVLRKTVEKSLQMTDNFSGDPKIQQIAEAYALDAVDFAKNNFKINLDWSDGSVAHIETILGIFHDQITTSKPSKEQVYQFAKLFGSYVGEVFRRNHGATWGLVTLQGQSFPGLKADGAAGLFWPWGRAQNRLTDGPNDNIWHYYQDLIEKDNPAGRPPTWSSRAP
jgi:hypothetical protein